MLINKQEMGNMISAGAVTDTRHVKTKSRALTELVCNDYVYKVNILSSQIVTIVNKSPKIVV